MSRTNKQIPIFGLSEMERRIIVFVKLRERERGEGPTWREITDLLRTPNKPFFVVPIMHRLRRDGYLDFSDAAHSTTATEYGVREALRKNDEGRP